MIRQLGIKEIHSITLDLMDHLHDICEKNGLTYCLMYGTLLGAIRHKGFIPWDDDFDITMPREDYDRLFEMLENEKYGRYRLITRGNTKNYYNGIARFCDMKYIYQTELDVKQYEQGIFIDIYPLDSGADTLEETQDAHWKVKKLIAQYIIYCNKKSLSSKARSLLKIPYHYYLHLKYGKSFGKNIEKMTRDIIYSRYDMNAENVGVYWENDDFQLYKREWFLQRELWPFEDRKYWVPTRHDHILKLQYGDYMQLPPESERVATHSYSIYEKDE